MNINRAKLNLIDDILLSSKKKEICFKMFRILKKAGISAISFIINQNKTYQFQIVDSNNQGWSFFKYKLKQEVNRNHKNC
jgi:hypothetical protein